MGDSDEDHALLARIDERTQATSEHVLSIEKKLDRDFVTQKEFWPVKAIVYTGAGLTLTGVFVLVLKGAGVG